MTVNVAAAPMGARVGLSAARHGDRQIAITVGPKSWRPPGPKHHAVDASSWSDHTDLCLYETERLHVAKGHQDLENALWMALSVSRQEVPDGLSWDSSMLVPDIAPRPEAALGNLPQR